MRSRLFLALLVLSALGAMADAPGYRLRIDSSVQGSTLSVVPYIEAPAGASLRYEMASSRQGAAGRSNTSQSGRIAVGENGSAKLSALSFSVGPQDRYVVTVKVFDGAKVVAEQVLQYPQ
jgi:hypothetical protein